jgi:hypothetical protein
VWLTGSPPEIIAATVRRSSGALDIISRQEPERIADRRTGAGADRPKQSSGDKYRRSRYRPPKQYPIAYRPTAGAPDISSAAGIPPIAAHGIRYHIPRRSAYNRTGAAADAAPETAAGLDTDIMQLTFYHVTISKL